jgi:hypothetical protein
MRGNNNIGTTLSYTKNDNICVIENLIGLLLASGKPAISALLG